MMPARRARTVGRGLATLLGSTALLVPTTSTAQVVDTTGDWLTQPTPPSGAPPAMPSADPGPPPRVRPPPGSPAELPFTSGVVPPGYRLRTQDRTGLMWAGAGTFGGAYLLSVAVGAVLGAADEGINQFGCAVGGTVSTGLGSPQRACPPSENDFRPMYIPLVGPWITMGTGHVTAAGGLALALLGLGQATGVGLLVAGMATHGRRVLVRNDVAGRITIVPIGAPSSAGLAVVGRF